MCSQYEQVPNHLEKRKFNLYLGLGPWALGLFVGVNIQTKKGRNLTNRLLIPTSHSGTQAHRGGILSQEYPNF